MIASMPIDEDLGVPGLGLSSSGSVDGEFYYDVSLKLDLTEDGFFLNTDPEKLT